MAFTSWLKEKFGGKGEEDSNKVEVKKVKLKKSDIQRNLLNIDEQMTRVQSNIFTITNEIITLDDKFSEEGQERLKVLKAELDSLNSIYSDFQTQQSKNLELLKSMDKTGKTEIVLKVVSVVGTIFLSVVGLGLNRESPSILKMVDFIIKPFRPPLKF